MQENPLLLGRVLLPPRHRHTLGQRVERRLCTARPSASSPTSGPGRGRLRRERGGLRPLPGEGGRTSRGRQRRHEVWRRPEAARRRPHRAPRTLTLVVDPVETHPLRPRGLGRRAAGAGPGGPDAPGGGAPRRGREAARERGRTPSRSRRPWSARRRARPSAALPAGTHSLGALVEAARHPAPAPVATAKTPVPPGRHHVGARARRASPSASLEVDLGGQAQRFMSFVGHPGRRDLRGGRRGAGLRSLPGLRGRREEGRQRPHRATGASPSCSWPTSRARRRCGSSSSGGMAPDREAAAWAGALIAMGPWSWPCRVARTAARGQPRDPPIPLASGVDRPPAGHPPPARRRHDARPAVPVPHPGHRRGPARAFAAKGLPGRRHARPEDRHPQRLGEGRGHDGRADLAVSGPKGRATAKPEDRRRRSTRWRRRRPWAGTPGTSGASLSTRRR